MFEPAKKEKEKEHNKSQSVFRGRFRHDRARVTVSTNTLFYSTRREQENEPKIVQNNKKLAKYHWFTLPDIMCM